MDGLKERERTLRIGEGEEAGSTGEKLHGREMAEEEQEREKDRDERGMIAYAAQMCLKHRAALVMPSLNLYPHLLSIRRDPPSLLSLSTSRSFRARYRASRNPR